MLVENAQTQIEHLEFAPYEKANTVEGYMEFKARYPDNPHCSECNRNIEQLECKRCEESGTLEGYEEFLLKYPDSNSAELVKKKLAGLRALSNKEGLKKVHLHKKLSIPPNEMDGTQIMTKANNLNRAKDYIITTAWTLTEKGAQQSTVRSTWRREKTLMLRRIFSTSQ